MPARVPRDHPSSFRIPDPPHLFRTLLLFAFAAAACSGTRSETRKPAAPALVIRPLPSVTASRQAREAQPTPARSHRVATIARRAIGPFVARTGDRGIAAWIAPSERGAGRGLAVVLLRADGAPLDVPRVVGRVPQELTTLIVRPEGVGSGWPGGWSALRSGEQ